MDTKLLQPGDVILFAGKGFISRGIKFFTNSEFSHAAFYVGGGEGYLIEATQAGVEKNKFADVAAHAARICVRRRPGLTVEQVELLKDKAYSLIYERYDFTQFISLALYFTMRKIGITMSALVRNMPGRMICSELVAVAFLTLPLKFNSRPKLVTPETLFNTPELDTVYEEVVK